MLRPEIEDKLKEMIGEVELYKQEDDPDDEKYNLDMHTSLEDAFNMGVACFEKASVDIEKIADWITDNFEAKS